MWNDFSQHIPFGESWPVYQTERNEIFNFIRNNGIGGVVLLSGDEHWTGVFRLSPWGIYEVASGPITYAVNVPSSNDPQILFKLPWTRVFHVWDVDTVSVPASLTLRIIDANGFVRYTLSLTEEDLAPNGVRVPTLLPPGWVLLVGILIASAARMLTRPGIRPRPEP